MINSTDVDILVNKANKIYDKQRYDEAIQYYDKAVAIDPLNIYVLANKANLLTKLER